MTAVLTVLTALAGCGLGGHTTTPRTADPSPTSLSPTRDLTPPTSTTSPSPLTAMVSSDGGPLTAAETRTALARCLGKQASTRDITAARVEFARDIAYLTDDVLTLPTIVLISRGTRIVCNTDGRVPSTTGANREPSADHPAVVVASAGITGTFNGPFADGMSPFAPCVVLRVGPNVARVLMRLDWPTGDSVWYGAAIENGYAVVSAWMGGTIGSPVNIDLTTVRRQLRAFDATGRQIPVS